MQTDAAQKRFREELEVDVEALGPVGALAHPGETNTGLLGYLRSIGRVN
jgi:hypothetical protein